MKECSAYGQIDQGGSDREESHIYEHTQWPMSVKVSGIGVEQLNQGSRAVVKSDAQ